MATNGNINSGIPCLCCFDTNPPRDVKAKNMHGQMYGKILMIDHQNTFSVSLGDAPCADPCCCIGACLCAPHGITSCWARNAVLKAYSNGIEDYECCQGYITCCCVQPGTCKGSHVGLCLEGCCCPFISLSISRIVVMESLQLMPDPGDWQIIRFSNCMQVTACLCEIAAIFIPPLRELAHEIQHIAHLVLISVAGCMATQISQQIKQGPDYRVVDAEPINAGYNPPVVVGEPLPNAPSGEKMDRTYE